VAADNNTYKSYMLDMLKGTDAESAKAILTGMGYTGIDQLLDEDGNWRAEYLDADGNLDVSKA
jgi:hypothetical protein